MSDAPERHPITLKSVRYTLPGVDAVTVRRDVVYSASDTALSLDVYTPPASDASARAPAVVIAIAYPDVGVPLRLGCQFKAMNMIESWARLIAASGIAAISYTTRQPATDVHSVLKYLRQHAAALGVDHRRIGLFAASANVVVALSALMQDRDLKCAALLYGFTLDSDTSTTVLDASKAFGFVDACAGRSVDDLPERVPLFVVRAGRDEFAGLNATLDRFLHEALVRNLPVSLVNHATGAHAFDLDEDSEASRDIIGRVLAFLRFNLLAAAEV